MQQLKIFQPHSLIYERHRPEQTLLYKVIQGNLNTFLAQLPRGLYRLLRICQFLGELYLAKVQIKSFKNNELYLILNSLGSA